MKIFFYLSIFSFMLASGCKTQDANPADTIATSIDDTQNRTSAAVVPKFVEALLVATRKTVVIPCATKQSPRVATYDYLFDKYPKINTLWKTSKGLFGTALKHPNCTIIRCRIYDAIMKNTIKIDVKKDFVLLIGTSKTTDPNTLILDVKPSPGGRVADPLYSAWLEWFGKP